MEEDRYSLQELADAAGVSPRTVRYYIAEGLLPPPEPAGHKTSYSANHLNRLELIGLLKEAYLPLKEIRGQLAVLDDMDLERALVEARRTRKPALTIERNEDERHAHRSYLRLDDEPPAPRAARSPAREQRHEQNAGETEDAIAYIDRVLGKQQRRNRLPVPPPPIRQPARDTVWRRLPVGSSGEAELVISEAMYQRRKERIDSLLTWAEKMLDQD